MRPLLFGKYWLLERISVGGMAEVFRAKPFHAGNTQRYLALKRILPHLAEDEVFLKMLVDEAKLCVHLRHPNVVRVYELGQFQTAPYILMEYIPGQDVLALQKRLRRERLIMSVAQACYIAKELAKALAYAHNAVGSMGEPLGIIHRDVSPQNVLVRYDGTIKLIDFGVAKAASQSTKTQVGVLKGKFGYMSPEQIKGESIDPRSDLFAVGTMLWEMLTNRRLFTGDSEFDIFQKVKEARVDPPSVKNPQVPSEVDRIVLKALARDPAQRYQWGHELAMDLEAFLVSIQPTYTAQHLSDWMSRFFQEERAEEEEKSVTFQEIQTPDDVRRILFGDAPKQVEEPSEDATRIWDAEVVPENDQDVEEFAALHTKVAAGGFDLEEFVLEDGDIELVEEQASSLLQPMVTGAPQLGGAASTNLAGVTQERPQLSASMMHTMQAKPVSAPAAGHLTKEALARKVSRRNRFAAASVVTILACLVLSVLVVQRLRLPSGAEGSGALASKCPGDKGTLVLTVTPNQDLKVLVNGKVMSDAAPLTLKELEPGKLHIVIRHDGYEKYEKMVTLEAGSFYPLDVVLTPK